MRNPSPSTPRNGRRRTPAEDYPGDHCCVPSAGSSMSDTLGAGGGGLRGRRRRRQRHRRARYPCQRHRPGRSHRITGQAGVGRYRGRDLGWSGFRALAAGSQARLRARIWTGLSTSEKGLMGNGELLKFSTRKPGPRNKRAQLARFARGDVLDGRIGGSREGHRSSRPTHVVREVREPEPAHDGSGVGVVVVEEVADAFGAACRIFPEPCADRPGPA